MKKRKNYLLVSLLSASLLTGMTVPKVVRASEDHVEDVQLICESVYQENGTTYALLDFTSDFITEVYVSGALKTSGTSLHHVVVPVTPNKRVEIGVCVDNGEECFETSFILTPIIDLTESDTGSEEDKGTAPKNTENDEKSNEDKSREEEESSDEGTSEDGEDSEDEEWDDEDSEDEDWDDEDWDDEDSEDEDWDDEEWDDEDEDWDDEDSEDEDWDDEDSEDEDWDDEDSEDEDWDDEDWDDEDWDDEEGISKLPISTLPLIPHEMLTYLWEHPDSLDSISKEELSYVSSSISYPRYAYATSRDVVVEYTVGNPDGAVSMVLLPPMVQKTTSMDSTVTSTTESTFATEPTSMTDAQTKIGFQWSGGSGKLKNIQCTNVRMEDGNAIATIVFESGHYQYVKVDGVTYDPTVQTEETTTFEIPVTLHENLEILAMTTAMSEPHEIAYTIYVDLQDGQTDSAENAYDGRYGELIQAADVYPLEGFSYLGSLKTEAAKLFQVHFYEKGLVILEIAAPKETQDFSEDLDLYSRDTLRYLLIPEDVQIPTGIEKELILVPKPVDAAYVDSELVWSLLEDNESFSALFAISDVEKLKDQETLKQKVEEKEIQCLGTAPNLSVKELLLGTCDLVVTEPFEDSKLWQELTSDLTMLKIPLVLDRSVEEQTPNAKEEWKIVTKLLFDLNERDA